MLKILSCVTYIWELIVNFVFHRGQYKVRGSFITFVTTIIVFFGFLNILYMINYAFYTNKVPITQLSELITNVLGILMTAYGLITGVYVYKKTSDKTRETGSLYYEKRYRPQRNAHERMHAADVSGADADEDETENPDLLKQRD